MSTYNVLNVNKLFKVKRPMGSICIINIYIFQNIVYYKL